MRMSSADTLLLSFFVRARETHQTNKHSSSDICSTKINKKKKLKSVWNLFVCLLESGWRKAGFLSNSVKPA